MIALLLAGACVAAGQPTGDAARKEMKRFQGKWKAVAAYSEGKPLSTEELKVVSLVVEGNTFTLESGGTTIKGTFAIDPTQKTKTIDVFINGEKENIVRGIYEITGDRRKSCFAINKDRPDRFRKEKDYLYLEWAPAK
jgi:uncharacterized protein (TIGR03067 family)